MEERIFAIGDIHGCRTHLIRMLDLIPWNPEKDRILFIGDYIDRGNDSKGVVDIVEQIKREYPQTICLLGNHERMLLDYLGGRDRMLYFFNGGGKTLESYGLSARDNVVKGIPKSHREFFMNLQLYFETDDYLFVHAGLRPNIPLERQDPHDLVWIREDFFMADVQYEKTIIFGHTPFREPLVQPGKIGIDTGAVYGNKLTCIELPVKKFHYV